MSTVGGGGTSLNEMFKDPPVAAPVVLIVDGQHVVRRPRGREEATAPGPHATVWRLPWVPTPTRTPAE